MKHLVIFLSILVLLTSSAKAITLDDFSDPGVVSSSSPGVGKSLVTTTQSAIGGFRTLFAIKNSSGTGETRLETFPDPGFVGDLNFSLGYTQGVHTGLGSITWDGNNIGDSTSVSGLGSIDLTQDNATAFRVAIKFFDFPLSKSIDLALRLYDSSNPLGLKYSDVSITLDQPISITSPILLEIPFERFLTSGASSIQGSQGGLPLFKTSTIFGPGGAVDFKQLGAAQLILNGQSNSNAPDLTLDFIATNGRCNILPNAQGRVVDECGVCLNSQFANKGRDLCGICLFGPPSYKYTPATDECGLCPSAPDYTRAKDACGVCGGSVRDSSKCVSAKSSCVTIAATKEVLEFEDRLMKQARKVLSRFRDESRRATRNDCQIDLRQMTNRVNQAFRIIRADGNATFTRGVEVCGDSCVTISYAAQVQALTPQFKVIERITTSLARQVSQCYRKKNITSAGGINGNATTFQSVNLGLAKLIDDCKNRQVCPK